MARNVVKWTATEGRDKGKVFKLTEMSASKGEAWAIKVLTAMMQADVELPGNMTAMSMAVLAQMGMKALAGISWMVLEPLLAEIMTCVEIIPNPKDPVGFSRKLVIGTDDDEDVEEMETLFNLRLEVFKLHTGFLRAVAPLVAKAEAALANNQKLNS